MPFSLSGKATLITGGTAGNRLTMAKQFASHGANVVITGRRENGDPRLKAAVLLFSVV